MYLHFDAHSTDTYTISHYLVTLFSCLSQHLYTISAGQFIIAITAVLSVLGVVFIIVIMSLVFVVLCCCRESKVVFVSPVKASIACVFHCSLYPTPKLLQMPHSQTCYMSRFPVYGLGLRLQTHKMIKRRPC